VHLAQADLFQVLLNLVMNACDAMAGIARDARQLTIRTSLGRYDSVRISVTDCGVGIPPEKMEQVFEPYYTTKAKTPHGGLGLAICRRIVKDHGGVMWAANNPGRGATFHFTLPAGKGGGGASVEGKKQDSRFAVGNSGRLGRASRQHLARLLAFEADFARNLLLRALLALEAEYRSSGRDREFELFRKRMIEPALEGTTPPSLADLAQQLELSEKEAANRLVTARWVFQRLLRAEIRLYATTNEEVEGAIRDQFPFLNDNCKP